MISNLRAFGFQASAPSPSPDGTAREGHRQIGDGFAGDHSTSRGALGGVGAHCGASRHVLAAGDGRG